MKAIMSVDIFGYPANLIKIRKTKKFNLKNYI